ncbi:MAG: hypothetical protein L3J43_02475 [Sulfurovum sp.]|nr:hypothetical protein [Sulfurovum sp.]
MRIQSPDDEKYFKDITLNHILDEISNETKKHPTKPAYAYEEDKPQKRFFIQLLFFGIVPILLLLFFFVPIKQIKKIVTKPSNTAPTQTKIVYKQNKKELPNKVEPRKDVAIEKSKIIKIVPKKTKPPTESIRKKAKNNLLKQMKI